MRTVMQAVQRNHLQADTVHAMHQNAMKWSEVTALVKAALHDANPQ